MKIIHYIILVQSLLLGATSLNASGHPFEFNTDPPKDSTDLTNLPTWPDCPLVKNIRTLSVGENQKMIVWDGYNSDQIEYEIAIHDSKENLIHSAYVNNSSYLLDLKDLNKNKYKISIRSHCYEENSLHKSNSKWTSEFTSISSNISSSICNEYLNFIEQLDSRSGGNTGTQVGLTNLPFGMEMTADICAGSKCQTITNNPNGNSIATFQYSIAPGAIEINNVTFATPSGIVSCDGWENVDPDCPGMGIQVHASIVGYGPNATLDLQISDNFNDDCNPGLAVTVSPPSGANGNGNGFQNMTFNSSSYTGCGTYQISVTTGNCNCTFPIDVPCAPPSGPPMECSFGGEVAQSIVVNQDCTTNPPSFTLEINPVTYGLCSPALDVEIQVTDASGNIIVDQSYNNADGDTYQPISIDNPGSYEINITNSCDGDSFSCNHPFDLTCSSPPGPPGPPAGPPVECSFENEVAQSILVYQDCTTNPPSFTIDIDPVTPGLCQPALDVNIQVADSSGNIIVSQSYEHEDGDSYQPITITDPGSYELNIINSCNGESYECNHQLDLTCSGGPGPNGPPGPNCCAEPPTCNDLEVEVFYSGYSSEAFAGQDVCMATLQTNYGLEMDVSYNYGGEVEQSSTNNSSGLVAVPTGSEVSLVYELIWNDDDGNQVTTECSQVITIDCATNDPPPSTPNPELCSLIDFTQIGNCNIGWTAPDSIEVFMIGTTNGSGVMESSMNGSMTNELGYITDAEFYITYTNDAGELQTANCAQSIDPCNEDPEGDPDDEENEDLCDQINISIDTTGFLPYYNLNWVIVEVDQIELTYSINGTGEINGTTQSGNIEITPGDIITLEIILHNGDKESNCTFSYQTNELDEDDEIDENLLCRFFSLLEAEISTDNLLYLTIALGDEETINALLQELGEEIEDIEELISLLQNIEMSLDYVNEEFPDGSSMIIDIYGNPTDSGLGGNSYYFDPITWNYTIDEISTIGISGTFDLNVIDVDGNTYSCGSYDLPVHELEEDEEEDDGEIDLDCGDQPDENYDPSIPAYQGETEDLIGKIVTVRGFPIIITDISGGGPYNGEAFAALPFESAQILIDFSGLNINHDKTNGIYQATSGTITAVSDDPGNYPGFNVPNVPLNPGADFCVPPPPPGETGSNGGNSSTGLDEYGFNPLTGEYGEDGDTWDSNGFDINGNYILGEPPFNEDGSPNLAEPPYSTYNPDGCDRDGMDDQEPPQPCNPSGDDTDLTPFIDSTETETKVAIDSLLKVMVTELTDSIVALDCEQYRTIINNKISSLGYDPAHIIGGDNEYIEKGMSENFDSEPKEFSINIGGRNADTEALEDNHVALFGCDVEELKLDEAIENINVICADPNNIEVYNHIKSLIEAWGSVDKERYINDSDAFASWLEDEVRKYIEESVLDEGIGAVMDPHMEVIPHLKEVFDFSNYNSGYGALAATQDFSFSGNELDAVSFSFMQGDEYIKGIHRAYFLKALTEASASMTGGNGTLPLVISKQMGSYEYKIYIDNITWGVDLTPTLDAYFLMEDPESGKSFAFSGTGIPFAPGGLTGGEESRLSLISDVELILNNSAKVILRGTGNTYVEWSCSGFDRMGVDLAIEFCRDFIVPLESDYTPKPAEENYRLEMTTVITEWLEFTLTVNSPSPFSMAKYEDIKFNFSDIVVDMSSEAGSGITPLEGYQSEFLEDGTLNEKWKGFYIQSLDVILPNQFSEGSGELSVSANDVIIDGSGVTGQTSVSNESILDKETGNMGGWPMGIDSFSMTVINNHVAGIDIGGVINVPIMDEYMDYTATIFPGQNYEFTISPLEEATINMFLAKATIDPNSSISLGATNGVFHAEAILTGELEVTGSNGSSGLGISVPKLEFKGLTVRNQAPYFDAGDWELVGDINANFKGFNLTLSNIGMYDAGNEMAGLNFDIGLTLSDDVGGLSILGNIGIVGNLTVNNDRQRWVFSHLDPNQFCLNTSFPGVEKIDACLEWYPEGADPDPVYGEGFRGSAEVQFKGFDGTLAAIAQFGKKVNENYKYFFIDALGTFTPGITVGPLSLNGFGGGVSHHMQNTFDPASIDFANQTSTGSNIGESFSGIVYVPDITKGLGLRASTTFTLAGKEELFNGTAEFGMTFNSQDSEEGGGLAEMYMKGIGNLISPANTNPSMLNNLSDEKATGLNQNPDIGSALSGYVYFIYDFNSPSFIGDIGVFLDAGPLQGAGAGGKLVDGKISFTPSDWHIQFGLPSYGQRCGATLGIGNNINLDLNAYFVTGSSIPSIPPVPDFVREIAYSYKPFNGLSSPGPGIVFGAGFKAEVSAGGNLIGGYLMAEAGFDVMLKKFSAVTCNGSSIGINGWYAAGQAYAAIEGSVKVMGVEVFKAGVAAILQARLPNPTLVSGTVGVRFKVLWKTFNKSVNLSIGNNCQLQSSDPNSALGMELISYFDPSDGTEDIAPEINPRIYINAPLGETFKVIDFNGEEHSYIIDMPVADDLIVTTADGGEHPVRISYEPGALYIDVIPYYMFPSQDSITVQLTLSVDKNGEFLTDETKQVSFKTGDAIDYIPKSNVVSSYPYDGMYNYYKGENPDCYIELDMGHPELLVDIPESETQAFLLTSSTGENTILPYTYDIYENRINFRLEPELLTGGEIYMLQLVRGEEIIPVAVSSGGGNPNALMAPLALNDERPMGNQVIFKVYFRASEYDFFSDKLEAVAALPDVVEISSGISGEATFISKDMIGMEPFTRDENITFNFNYQSNAWWKNNYKNNLYSVFPVEIDICQSGGGRTETPAGITPFFDHKHLSETVHIVSPNIKVRRSTFHGENLQEEESNVRFILGTRVSFDFRQAKRQTTTCENDITTWCETEFQDLDSGGSSFDLQDCIDNHLPQNVQQFKNRAFVDLSPGAYTATVTYRLPDNAQTAGGAPSSIQTLTFTN